jgi:zinc protease
MINRSAAPQIHDAVSFHFHLPPCNKLECKNGIPLYWLKAGAQEVIEISLVFKAGIWHESQTAVAQTVAALLKSGTHNKSALAISEAIEYYGASLKVSTNNDWSFVTLHCLSKHVGALLPTLFEIITQASFPEEELQLYKQNALQRLAVNLMQCDFVANRNIDALLFGRQHPYGKYTEVQDIEALATAALSAYHQQYFTAANCQIFVAGNYSDETLAQIERVFGTEKWNENTSPDSHAATPELQPAVVGAKRIINDEQGVQGAIRMARHIPRRTEPVFPELFVMNTVFGGYFGSRLMANIREDKGYTYGIYSSLLSYQHGASMMIGTEAGREVCEAAIEEIKKEMHLMQTQKVDEQELLLVKNYLLGSILGDLDGPFSIMQRWKNLILNNQTAATFYTNIEVYKNITAERIQELAQTYLNANEFYELVVI